MSTAPDDLPDSTPDPTRAPHREPADPEVTTDARPVPAPGTGVPHTRTGAAWFGIWAGAFVLVLLIIFIAQNTGKVEINFLWLHGTIPLALALLIAGVGVAILAMVIATARITQLRRLIRRRR
jgi:putative membrane protein